LSNFLGNIVKNIGKIPVWIPVILSIVGAGIAIWQAFIAKGYAKSAERQAKSAEHQAQAAERSAKAAEENVKIAARSLDIKKQELFEQYLNAGIKQLEKQGNFSGFFDSVPLPRDEKVELLRAIGKRLGKTWDEIKFQGLIDSWIK
jgi:hypothetical protein